MKMTDSTVVASMGMILRLKHEELWNRIANRQEEKHYVLKPTSDASHQELWG